MEVPRADGHQGRAGEAGLGIRSGGLNIQPGLKIILNDSEYLFDTEHGPAVCSEPHSHGPVRFASAPSGVKVPVPSLQAVTEAQRG